MPYYEYDCDKHGIFSKFASINDRNKEVTCSSCGQIVKRVISSPNLALMSERNRAAWARNEKSAHEPRRSVKSSCSHQKVDSSTCSSANHSTIQHDRPNQRPWMIGH